MMGYRALEEAVSILKRYGREVARLLNQEHEDLNILRYQLYVFRRRACRRLERLGLAVREGWEAETDYTVSIP
jgi:predicted phage tail protein